MRRYRVFEPAGVEARSEGARFVADGFSLIALIVPALWLLRHRLFLAAIAVVLVDILIGLLAAGEDRHLIANALPLLLGLAIALEGSTLRARRLAAKGFREAAVVTAGSQREAELLYFLGEADAATVAAPLPPASPNPPAPAPASVRRPAGRTLFDLPGR